MKTSAKALFLALLFTSSSVFADDLETLISQSRAESRDITQICSSVSSTPNILEQMLVVHCENWKKLTRIEEHQKSGVPVIEKFPFHYFSDGYTTDCPGGRLTDRLCKKYADNICTNMGMKEAIAAKVAGNRFQEITCLGRF